MYDPNLPRRLKTLIAFRAIFVTLLLGSFFYFRIGYGIFPYPFSVLYLIIFLYLATIAYRLLLHRVPSVPLAYAQMLMDTLASIALIYMTGGIESWFSWLLLIVVFLSAIIISKHAAYTTATVGSLLYGLIINWQFYGVIPLPFQTMLEEKDFLYKALSHIGGLYLIAYLSGQLKARIEQSDTDLQDLSRFNRDVIESTPSGIVTTGLNGTVLLFNRSAESIMNIDRENIIGKNIAELFPFMNIPTREERIEGSVMVNSEQKEVGLRISSLLDASGIQSGFICTFQDLSELRRLTREIKSKESLATVGELSAKIAHEIRNPLASLKSAIELLKEGSITPDKQARLMDIALNEMDRLNNTITDFLKFSKPSPISRHEFDLFETLADIQELLRARQHTAHIEITRSVAAPMRIMADENKLKDVFWNLGINAFDAMPEGGSLHINAHIDGADIVISFQDSGPGVNDETKDKLFFPFYTTKTHGTGLGLSTAYRVIHDHGGRIEINNHPSGGAVVTITIPEGHV